MHEEDALCGALLAAARVRVLVTLPRDIVHLSHVRAENLPVEARVFEVRLAAHLQREPLGNLAAACIATRVLSP